MEVFRISSEKYATKLTSSGSANRWNKSKQFVIYTGSSRSLSSLELVVHRSAIKPKIKYKVMIVYIPDKQELFEQITLKELPKNWQSMAAYPKLQEIGAKWYNKKSSLILKIPSAVIPQEYNYVINTVHPKFSKTVKLVDVEDYFGILVCFRKPNLLLQVSTQCH